MHADSKSRDAFRVNRIHITLAVVLAAVAVTAGMSLSRPMAAEGAPGGAAVARAAAVTPSAPPSGAATDPSVPAALDALGGAATESTELPATF